MAPLDEERIFSRRQGPRYIGACGEVHDVVESTMDRARACCAEGAQDGYVVLAEQQSAGRGRTGPWRCPPGLGLLMSLVLRLGLPSMRQRLIVLMAAVAIVEALRELGVDASIKWPNDIVVAGQEQGKLTVRKLGGLIVERVQTSHGPAAHVLGVGLNINQQDGDLPPDPRVPATSMRLEKNRAFDRNAVCRAVLERMDAWYRILARGQEERILARWRSHSCLLGHTVLVRLQGVGLQARVEGIRATGEIMMRMPDGALRVFNDSDVDILF